MLQISPHFSVRGVRATERVSLLLLLLLLCRNCEGLSSVGGAVAHVGWVAHVRAVRVRARDNATRPHTRAVARAPHGDHAVVHEWFRSKTVAPNEALVDVASFREAP